MTTFLKLERILDGLSIIVVPWIIVGGDGRYYFITSDYSGPSDCVQGTRNWLRTWTTASGASLRMASGPVAGCQPRSTLTCGCRNF